MPPTSPTPPARPPRRYFRFTLRLLLASLTFLCLLLALWTHRAREQRRIVERIRQGEGTVRYNYETGPYFASGPDPQRWEFTPVPLWLIDLLGEDYFHDVREVSIRDKSILADLNKLWRLERLAIQNESVADEDLAALARVDSLASLTINFDLRLTDPCRVPVGDRSLALIGKMPSLKYAYITGSHFTAKGLESLARSTSLQTIYVSSCDDSVDSQIGEHFKKSGRVKRLCIRRFIPEPGRASAGRESSTGRYQDIVEW